MEENIIVSPYTLADIEKLYDAGATSILVGIDAFPFASTIYVNHDELKEARKQTKALGMNLYVNLNAFFMEHDIDVLVKELKVLKDVGVDGIYFTDLAVYTEAKKLDMTDLLIYNPDTLLTNHLDVQEYLNLGLQMCTLASEITLEDVVSIASKVTGRVEVIVHGRLSMMHSKRTLLTNYMRFINSDHPVVDNKRLYLIEEKRDDHMPIFEDVSGTHMYTGFTLASFEEMDDFVKAGIRDFRIESMFSNVDELCRIIKDYRYVLKHPESGRAFYQEYERNFVEQHITKGFLYTKTGAKK
ncbi:hypothetical protein A4S06_11270 [Erysipelotrichaceae bacterium MTC7]|nr:hypothetical protein A4S06_11270 [Erysipelotrichaceae bacterium MTC7]